MIIFPAQDAFNAFDFLGQGFIFSHDIMEALMFIMVKAHKNDQENIVQTFRYPFFFTTSYCRKNLPPKITL